MAANRYLSPAISLEPLDPDFSRADIEFHDVDHSGASFEAAVFLDNQRATETTPKTPHEGYAGSFHIFGHGGCFGDVGHCDVVVQRRPFDPRPGHPLTPALKVVIATDAVRAALRRGRSVTVTVVPRVTASTDKCDVEDVLKFGRLAIVTYR
jgi:hypothetical protein